MFIIYLGNDNIIQDHQTGLCTNNEPSQILNEEPSNHTISTGTSATFHAIPSSSYQIIQISGSHYFPPKNNVKCTIYNLSLYLYLNTTFNTLLLCR